MKNIFKFVLMMGIFLFGFSPLFAEESVMEKEDALPPSEEVSGRIERVTDDFYINLDYYDKYRSYGRLCERQNNLNGWSKFCMVYGLICAGVGGFDLGMGIAEGEPYVITIGALCATEGIIVAAVGGSLKKKRDNARTEIMRINSVGFPAAEFESGKVKLLPSVNLLSDNCSRDKAWGLGLRIEF